MDAEELRKMVIPDLPQLYKKDDLVYIYGQKMIVVNHFGKLKSGDSDWVNQYHCVPVNKKNKPDQRALNANIHIKLSKYIFNENVMTKCEE